MICTAHQHALVTTLPYRLLAATRIIIIIMIIIITEAAREAGAVAELAATRKEVKYASIVGRHMFEPIAVETLGVFNASAIRLLNDLGRRIHGRRNRGVWGDNVPLTSGTSGVQWSTGGGRSNDNDLCFYSRQCLFSTVQVTYISTFCLK